MDNSDNLIDFPITNKDPESVNEFHFRNSCATTFFYSCAVDCFLEICFRLFLNNLQEISNQRSNLFEIIMSVLQVYEVAILNFDSHLLFQVREPIWDCIVSNCPSFAPRKCEAEFSQIFTGTMFNSLSFEEKILFSSFYSVTGVCLESNKNIEKNCYIISEIELMNSDDFSNGWPHFLSSNNTRDTKMQCNECESLNEGNLVSFQASTFRFVILISLLVCYAIQNVFFFFN